MAKFGGDVRLQQVRSWLLMTSSERLLEAGKHMQAGVNNVALILIIGTFKKHQNRTRKVSLEAHPPVCDRT